MVVSKTRKQETEKISDEMILWLVELQYGLDSGLFNYSDEDIEDAIKRGIVQETPVGLMPVNPVLQKTATTIKEKKLDLNKDIDWLNDYRKIFKAARNGNMGNKGQCIAKMNQFMHDYPEYNKGIIMKAAKSYIDECVRNDRFARQADYFISKTENGIKFSELEDWCDRVVNDNVDDGFDAEFLI